MKTIFAMLILSLTISNTFAAQDHNSSRSNKTNTVAGDLSDAAGDFAKEISVADVEEYTRGGRKIMNDLKSMENRVDYMKASLSIGIFANLLLKQVKSLRCKSFEDTACVSLAIENAEELALRKQMKDSVIQNIR